MDSSSPVGPRVFISYAHDTEQHKAQVRRFCALLRKCGVDARMDAYDNDQRRDWYAWMIDHVTQADYTIVIASPDYARAGDGTAPAHQNRGVQSESALLRDLYHSDRETWVPRILPVILPGSSLDGVPQFLQPHCADHYRINELTQDGIEDLLRIVTGQAPYLLPKLGDIPLLPPLDELSPSTETPTAGNNGACLVDTVLERVLAPATDRVDGHDLIVSLDFWEPGDRTDVEVLAVRDRVYQAVRRAFDDAGVSADKCAIRGYHEDGTLILVPADIPKARILGVWIHQLYEYLKVGSGLQVRIGVHSGQADSDVDLACRLASSVHARRLARAAHPAPVVVVVSDEIFQSVVRHGGRFVEPDSYRSESDADTLVWMCVPGRSIPPALRDEQCEPPKPQWSDRRTTGGGRVVNVHGSGAIVIDTATAGRDLSIGHHYGKESP